MKAAFLATLAIIVFVAIADVGFCQGIRITSPLPVGIITNPTRIGPSAVVTWDIDGSTDRPGVLQVYLHEKLIYPEKNPHRESAPGLTVTQLKFRALDPKQITN